MTDLVVVPRAFLQELLNECQIGDINEVSEHAGWRHIYTEAKKHIERGIDGLTEKHAFENVMTEMGGPDSVAPWLGTNAYQNSRVNDMREGWRLALQWRDATSPPVNMILHCPECHTQHIDSAEYTDSPFGRTMTWDNRPHKSHLCKSCGCVWRPSDVPTYGVESLNSSGVDDTHENDNPGHRQQLVSIGVLTQNKEGKRSVRLFGDEDIPIPLRENTVPVLVPMEPAEANVYMNALTNIAAALVSVQSGLAWYRDRHPLDVNGSDDEHDECVALALKSVEALQCGLVYVSDQKMFQEMYAKFIAACKTLDSMGYNYLGWGYWKPPLGRLLSKDEVTKVWEGMPGGPAGWLKEFGYLQFAERVQHEYISLNISFRRK